MAILKIKSGNKNISHVLCKNPASGLFVKQARHGMLFGYFPLRNGELIDTEYVIYFKDGSDKISFKKHPDETFDHLNASKYNDARFLKEVTQNVLHSAREGKGEVPKYDVPSNHMIEVGMVNTEFKTIDIFRRYFKDVEIDSEELTPNNFRLKFITEVKMKFQRLLQIIDLFSMFAQLNSPTYTYIEECLVQKYVRIANELDVPYFMRYLIKVRMCRAEGKFNIVKDDLVKHSTLKIHMEHGDTHENRIAWIKSHLDKDKPIIDIGTGIDYRYMRLYAPILQENDLVYYAIERDENARGRIQAAIRNRGWDMTVMLFESIEEFMTYHKEYLEGQVFNIICTEVLEHNEFDEAKAIVSRIHNNIKYDKFVITVPNGDFNVHYGLDGFRHHDHKWEGDISTAISLFNKKANVSVYPVGDIVDDQSVSFGFILSNNK